MADAPPLIRVRGLSHAFGGVRALSEVDLEVRAGEVHALCGENGAGKSTLNRVLSGTLRPDAGEVWVDGRPLALGSVRNAEGAGIVLVTQEPSWFPELDAADNVHLMHEPRRWGALLDRARMRSETRSALDGLGETFPEDTPLEELSFAQRQMVSLARAVRRQCRLLILDEPTASLSQRETEALFNVIRGLVAEGVAVLYVTHRLEEVFALADRVSVLRDGRHVATEQVSALDRDRLIHLMVGRDVPAARPSSAKTGAVALEVRGLTRAGVFEDVSLTVRAGEIVALAGLVGAGRSEVARAAFGLDPVDSGEVLLAGESLRTGDPSESIRRGFACVPEDRQHEGLHPPMTVGENIAMASLPRLWVRAREEIAVAERAVADLGVRTDSVEAPVASLSGGNQQKVLLAKWLETHPKVLLLDEPTRGVDVGAKEQVHALIRELAARGVAVLVISSELPEVLALADRVLVMSQGRISGQLEGEEATQEAILKLALPRSGEAVLVPSRGGIRRESGVALLLALTVLAATIVNPSFLALDNLRDMLVRVAPAAIVGCGLTLVVMTREIDISMGSLMGLCAAVLGIAASPDRLGMGVASAVVLCLGTGLAGGLLNGWLVAYGRVPSIIVTLGTLSVFRGMTELLMGGVWITNVPSGLRAFGTGAVLGVPAILWVALAVAAGAVMVTLRTPLGRRVLALGSNPAGAVRLGMPVRRVRLGVFALTGLLAGLATLFSATQLRVFESGFGSGFELMVVASVVVGGTSIRGGRGSIVGTLLGATLLGIVGTVLIFLRLGDSASYWDRAVQGAFILAAVVADSVSRRRVA